MIKHRCLHKLAHTHIPSGQVFDYNDDDDDDDNIRPCKLLIGGCEMLKSSQIKFTPTCVLVSHIIHMGRPVCVCVP